MIPTTKLKAAPPTNLLNLRKRKKTTLFFFNSKEGLQSANQAPSSTDQSTQQNAAMVEEYSAASKQMALEADQLRRLLNEFVLDEASTGSREGVNKSGGKTHVIDAVGTGTSGSNLRIVS
jgi:hypothetical protein